MKEKQFQILVLGEYEPLPREQISAKTDPKEANSVVVIMVSGTPLH